MGTRLQITGLGLASALGTRVETAAAAFRAGISRAQAIPGLMVDTAAGDEVPVHVHQVHPPLGGAEGFALWLHLGRLAWSDLVRFTACPAERLAQAASRLGLIIVLPTISDERFGWEDDAIATLVDEHLAIPLLHQAGVPLPADQRVVITGGHTGAITALQLAEEGVAADRWERVVILAIDSHLDPATLDFLAESGRLKTPEPAGRLRVRRC